VSLPSIEAVPGFLSAASALVNTSLHWLSPVACPFCGQRCGGAASLCEACRTRLELPGEGLRGAAPLPWWAAGSYEGALRLELLGLRSRPRPQALRALARTIRPPLATGPLHPLLVPVPSWKRRANPLPPLLSRCLARQLGLARVELLRRTHPVLGQHHLGRALRFANQRGSFACRRPPRAGEARRRPLLLVDDILTSGATALAAAEALQQGGWRVHGLLCLARTPAQRQRRDLEWASRQGGRPG
jgi:predicted amidophosphoribosyltransferase